MLDARDLSIERVAHLDPQAIRLALSPDHSRLWVSHLPENKISVLNAATLETLEVMDLGLAISRPYGIAVRPASAHMTDFHAENQAFVAMEALQKIFVFDMDDPRAPATRLASIGVSSTPDVIVMTPDHRKAYVIDLHTPQIAVVDCTRGKEVAVIDLSGRAHSLQEGVVSPDGTRLYVTDRHVAGQILAIDTTSDTVVESETFSTDPFPRAIGISPDGQYLFVGCIEVSGLSPGCIKMHRLSDGDVVDSVTPADLSNPRTMAVALRGSRIFVADHGSHVCFAFDVTYGGSPGLTEIAVARLDTQPGVDPCPVEVVVGQPPPKQTRR